MHKETANLTNIVLKAAEKARAETSTEPEPHLTQALDWPINCTVGPGLEGAIACETKVGYVNGAKGWLVYRGYDIFDLCAHSTFEEVTYLLLHGNLPNAAELSEFNAKLVEYRFLPSTLRMLMAFPIEELNTMAALRLGTNLMRQKQTERDREAHRPDIATAIASDEDSIPMETQPRGEDHAIYEFQDSTVNRPHRSQSLEELQEARGVESCYHLIAGMSTLTAAITRLRQGNLPIEPRRDLSHAANLLYMMTGREPSATEERIMNIALILHADHGMNASTFASMVVASTLSDIYFSVGSGISALNGPLHGGANEQVLQVLRQIGSPAKVADWYNERRARKDKIMGFGHRVYKAYDPRARILEPLAAYMVERSECAEVAELFKTAKALEQVVVDDLGKSKGIFPNVDYYSGIVYAGMGIPPQMFTPIFAVARVSGWTARVLEYMKRNRIFRPRAMYIGGFDRKYVPLEERQATSCCTNDTTI